MKNLKLLVALISLNFFVVSCNNDDDEILFADCTTEAEVGNITAINDEEAHVFTSIVIDATPNQVWSVLTDFESYSDWSSTFQGLEGDISNGGEVNALFPLEDGTIVEFPHSLIFTEGVSFGWSDPVLILPGIVDNHFYTVEFCGNQTNFVQTDEFIGNNQNVPAIGLANALLPGYQTFNQELKAEVERRF